MGEIKANADSYCQRTWKHYSETFPEFNFCVEYSDKVIRVSVSKDGYRVSYPLIRELYEFNRKTLDLRFQWAMVDLEQAAYLPQNFDFAKWYAQFIKRIDPQLSLDLGDM